MFLPNFPEYFYQLLATLLGDLQSLSYGFMFGVTPSALILYQSDCTPLSRRITEDEASWITSYLCLGGVLGTVIFGSMADSWGRKTALQCSGLVQLIGWGSLVFGYKIWHVFLSRFMLGIGTGGAYIVLPIYVAEISSVDSRGSLGSYISTFRSLGILMGFILGVHLNYNITALIGVGITLIFVMTFPFMQESPYYFAMQNDIPMMEKSLRWFKGVRSPEDRNKPEFLREIEKFRNMIEFQKSEQSHQITICSKYFWKICIIALVLVTTSQFCGVFAVLNYANVIFTEINSGFSANDAGIILAVMQFLSTYLATLIADRMNRKILIAFTSFGAGVFLIVFGVFIFLQEQVVILNDYMWVPLLCLSLTIILANVGLYPLAFVVISEIFPQNVKGFFTTVFMTYLWLLAFVSVKYYYVLTNLLGVYGCMWIFSGFCIFQFVFTLIFIPETRGKSFEEIQVILSGKQVI